jgi:alpha-1,4-digalacturonate transport system substrate-binding protein
MKRKLISSLALMLVFACLFVSCEKKSKADEPVTLTGIWFNDGRESEVFMETMQDYLAAHPNIKIDLQVIAYTGYDDKLKMIISGGDVPDFARLTTGSITVFAEQTLPLASYIPNLKDLEKEYMPAMLPWTYNKAGQMMALPIEVSANGPIVNKTAFRNAGIDIDEVSKTWVWEEFPGIVKKVVAANPGVQYGLVVDKTVHRFATLAYAFGSNFLNKDKSGMNFSSPEMIQSIKFFKSMVDDGTMTPSVWLGTQNSNEVFQSGVAAVHIGGSFNLNGHNTNIKNFEWGAVHNPKGKILSSVPGGKFIASFKGAKHPQEAADLIKAFADKQHLSQYCRDTFNMSPRFDTDINYPSNSVDFQIFGEDLAVTPEYAGAEWVPPAILGMQSSFLEQMGEVLQGKISAEQMADILDKQAKEKFF